MLLSLSQCYFYALASIILAVWVWVVGSKQLCCRVLLFLTGKGAHLSQCCVFSHLLFSVLSRAAYCGQVQLCSLHKAAFAGQTYCALK